MNDPNMNVEGWQYHGKTSEGPNDAIGHHEWTKDEKRVLVGHLEHLSGEDAYGIECTTDDGDLLLCEKRDTETEAVAFAQEWMKTAPTTYKGYEYFIDEHGVWTVRSPDGDLFIPSLDDSKVSGARTNNENANNAATCRAYIDWVST